MVRTCYVFWLHYKSLYHPDSHVLSPLQRHWEMQITKTNWFSEHTRQTLTTHFTSGPPEALSSNLRARSGTSCPEQPLQTLRRCTVWRLNLLCIISISKTLCVRVCVCVHALSQHSMLILTDSATSLSLSLPPCYRWAAKTRIFWIFLWMWSRTHQ